MKSTERDETGRVMFRDLLLCYDFVGLFSQPDLNSENVIIFRGIPRHKIRCTTFGSLAVISNTKDGLKVAEGPPKK